MFLRRFELLIGIQNASTSHRAERLVQPVEKIRLVRPQGAGRGKPNKVGSRKGKPAQLWGQADQKTLRWDLSAMGEQSSALVFTVRPDIQRHRGRLRSGAPGTAWPTLHPVHIKSRSDEFGHQFLPTAVVDLCHTVQLSWSPRRSGFWKCFGIPSGLKGINADFMTHNVVWVRIHSTRWLGDDDTWPKLADNADQFARCLNSFGIHERFRVLIGRRARHPRIPVAEHPELSHTENRTGVLHLLGSDFPQPRSIRHRIQVWVVDLTLLASGADHNPGPHISRTVIGEHPAGRGAFIVRVWTNCQQGHGLRAKFIRENRPVYCPSSGNAIQRV